MDYETLISTGTDDDLAPSYHTRISKRGRGGERGRHTVDLAPHSRLSLSSHMEAKIHSLEQGAYASVLCAFQAQSDAISWEKESLMAELRKELRVSDDEHRELLSKVKADDTIHQIREWRQTGGNQVVLNTSRKKRRISESVQHLSSYASVKPISYPSGLHNRLLDNPSGEADPHSGRKVWMRLPEDNCIYEAMPPEDTQWEEDPSSISSERNRGAVGQGKGCNGRAPDSLKLTAATNNQIDIELFNTRSLVKEVSRVFVASNPSPAEIFKAKKMLKEHELALVEAIARLGDASDSESDGEEAYAEGQLMEL